jgi:rare lipoprotein A
LCAADKADGPEVGLASWYGVPFHGRRTAMGERFDMHRMTAAHKTMPLPSYALVRHRATGKEVVVRVNDRGPFIAGRIIDLSRAAAREIGILGLGRVEVQRLAANDSRVRDWHARAQAPLAKPRRVAFR